MIEATNNEATNSEERNNNDTDESHIIEQEDLVGTMKSFSSGEKGTLPAAVRKQPGSTKELCLLDDYVSLPRNTLRTERDGKKSDTIRSEALSQMSQHHDQVVYGWFGCCF